MPLPIGASVPFALLQLIVDEMTARVVPFVTDSGGAPCALPFLVVLWRPATDFPKTKHIVTPEGQAVVRAALARMPAPTVLVDAGAEVWAGWRLATPIRDVAFARRELTRAAVALGGEDLDADDTRDLPLFGWIRNWNTTEPEPITIEVADPLRRYTLDELEGHIVNITKEIAHVGSEKPIAPNFRGARGARKAE